MAENRFHWVTQARATGADVLCDIDLTPESDVAVVPTIGPLVVGWVLTIPRVVAISAARLPDSEFPRLGKAVRLTANRVASLANRVFVFEHGPATIISPIGCGVDQAHVHIVPLDIDLLEMALDDLALKWFEVNPIDPWRHLDRTRSYYLVSDLETAYATYPEVETSQYFRRLIARGLGRPAEWNFRTHAHYENVKQTIRWFHPPD